MGAQVNAAIARVASGQFGVVTRPQLLAAGITARQIGRRVAAGALIPVHRGVYRVGHAAPSTDASYLAAVLACGAEAVLGGMAAAWRYGMVKGPAPTPEVIAPTRHDVPGVTCRRGRWPHVPFRGIPTLTVPATLVDIAARLAIEDLARACHEAGVRYGTTPRHVEAVLRRRRNSKGAANLRLVMSGDEKVALSRLESSFLALLRRENLPLPETNRPASGKRVDCRWPEHALTVELDSFTFHNSRHTWQQGHIRERQAYARGDAFRRYTWADVTETPAPMLAELEALLPQTRNPLRV